jgi:hypothetical protein
MNRLQIPQKTGCLQLLLLSFMLLGTALFFKNAGAGQETSIDRRGFVYMIALPGACLAWLRFRGK